MGTEVLRSRDCLNDGLFRQSPPPATKPCRRKPPRSFSLSTTTTTTPPARSRSRPGRRVSFSDKENAMVVKFPARNLVMEEVTILKRGEDLSTVRSSSPSDDHALCSTERLGPEPETLTKRIPFPAASVAGAAAPAALYAGPAFFSSPAPSALPFPSLFVKKDAAEVATRGLRCLLRLDHLP